MKRMSEVFYLPTTPNDFVVSSEVAVNPRGIETEQYTSHAINHVDALADALFSLLSDYSYENRMTANDALSNFRCEK